MPPIFSTLLCDEGGLLFVGGYNPQSTIGDPLYTPLYTSQGGYFFEIDDVGLDGTSLGLDVNSVTW